METNTVNTVEPHSLKLLVHYNVKTTEFQLNRSLLNMAPDDLNRDKSDGVEVEHQFRVQWGRGSNPSAERFPSE